MILHVGFCPVILLYYGLYIDAIAYSNAHYGQGTGPILLDNLACTGTEYNLTSCSYDSDTSDCTHYEDAGVHCNTTCEYSVVCILCCKCMVSMCVCVFYKNVSSQ